jgi:proline iminopeptidase
MAARLGYFAGVNLDPSAIQSALTKLTVPVLLLVGEADPMVTPAMAHAAAQVFNDAKVVVQAGAGHFPWVDDPAGFAAAVNSFLG